MNQVIILLSAILLLPTVLAPLPVHASSILRVPTNYSTIQSAVSAAKPGDTIMVSPGTYVEQVTIGKPLTLLGSGSGTTVIKAPSVLNPDAAGRTVIVEINNGIQVTMTGFAVDGPGPGACGSLDEGISVVDGSTLNLRSSAVNDIRDNPLSDCRGGVAIAVGRPFFIGGGAVGHAAITNVMISGYHRFGISVRGDGSTGTITDNLIIGVGHQTITADSFGIEAGFGGVATIVGNVVMGNLCDAPSVCGPDLINQFQVCGILLDYAGSGNSVKDNFVSENDIGICVAGSPSSGPITDNTVIDNRYAGIGFFDGSFSASNNKISGPGKAGVAVVAFSVDTSAALKGNETSAVSIPVLTVSVPGFSATVSVKD